MSTHNGTMLAGYRYIAAAQTSLLKTLWGVSRTVPSLDVAKLASTKVVVSMRHTLHSLPNTAPLLAGR